jgi:hypothetical protein
MCRCDNQYKTTMVVRLHPGQSRRLSACVDKQVSQGRFQMSSLCRSTSTFAVFQLLNKESRARICKCLWIPGIDSEERISPAHVAWRVGTINRVVVLDRQAGNRFLDFLKGLIRARVEIGTRISPCRKPQKIFVII